MTSEPPLLHPVVGRAHHAPGQQMVSRISLRTDGSSSFRLHALPLPKSRGTHLMTSTLHTPLGDALQGAFAPWGTLRGICGEPGGPPRLCMLAELLCWGPLSLYPSLRAWRACWSRGRPGLGQLGKGGAKGWLQSCGGACSLPRPSKGLWVAAKAGSLWFSCKRGTWLRKPLSPHNGPV